MVSGGGRLSIYAASLFMQHCYVKTRVENMRCLPSSLAGYVVVFHMTLRKSLKGLSIHLHVFGDFILPVRSC